MVKSSVNASKKDWAKSPLLPSTFYSRDTIQVSRELLGKLLVIRSELQIGIDDRKVTTVARIVETEAYTQDDPASHSARGQTLRSSVMFGDPGVAYVYFIYGMYEMLNFVAHPKGIAGAVLIRAVEPLIGEGAMSQRRKGIRSRLDLTRGPGRLCQAMGIRMEHNRESLFGPTIEVRDDGYFPALISSSSRVGIREGMDRFWRFFITDHPFVSRVPQNHESRMESFSGQPVGRMR